MLLNVLFSSIFDFLQNENFLTQCIRIGSVKVEIILLNRVSEINDSSLVP